MAFPGHHPQDNLGAKSILQTLTLVVNPFTLNLMPKDKDGFTLVELLIVIVLLGILSSFVATGVISAQRKGRDAQRKHDLTVFKKVMEQARNDCTGAAYYPNASSGVETTRFFQLADTSGWLVTNNYLQGKLVDPINSGGYGYKYDQNTLPSVAANVCTNSSSGKQAFVARALLENTKDPEANKSRISCSNIIAVSNFTNPQPASNDGNYYVCSEPK